MSVRLTPELRELLEEVGGSSRETVWLVLLRREGAPDPRVGERRFPDAERAHRWAGQATGGRSPLVAWVVRRQSAEWHLEGRYPAPEKRAEATG
jgi:hypothetical protein